MKQLRSVLAALAAVMLLAALPGIAVSPVTAQSTATVDVSATIGEIPSMSITVCDSTAVFGSGLTSTGAAPTGADAGVFVTDQGGGAGEGVFYVWNSPCDPNLTVTSNVNWQMSLCATENNGPGASPDVTVLDGDLRIKYDAPPQNTYNAWSQNFAVVVCSSSIFYSGVTSPMTLYLPLSLGLRVDDLDANGEFVSQLTLGVIAA